MARSSPARARVQFDNSTSTTLSGTITNNSNLALTSTGSFTDFVLDGNVTMSGSGVLSLVAAARIRGSGIFTNAGTTIEGETNASGSLGANEIGIVNQADGVSSPRMSPDSRCVVDPDSVDGLVNQGTMQADQRRHFAPQRKRRRHFHQQRYDQGERRHVAVQRHVTSSGTVDVGADSLSVTGSYTQNAGTFRLAGGSVTSTTDARFRRRPGRRLGNNQRPRS